MQIRVKKTVIIVSEVQGNGTLFRNYSALGRRQVSYLLVGFLCVDIPSFLSEVEEHALLINMDNKFLIRNTTGLD